MSEQYYDRGQPALFVAADVFVHQHFFSSSPFRLRLFPLAALVRHGRVGVAFFSHLGQGVIPGLPDLFRGGDGVLRLI